MTEESLKERKNNTKVALPFDVKGEEARTRVSAIKAAPEEASPGWIEIPTTPSFSLPKKAPTVITLEPVPEKDLNIRVLNKEPSGSPSRKKRL